MEHVALFLLWKVQDYATFAAPGRQYRLDMLAILANDTLNLRPIMLPSFRAFHER
jgi:hypothetical protein